MTLTEQVESLIKKAEKTHAAAEALHFSQAALNAANALCTLVTIKKISED